jgi:hypothetical protein
MTRADRALLPLALASFLALVFVVGCGPADFFGFYEVTRSRAEECIIRQNGEFCVEPEQFDPPVSEAWTVDLRGAGGFLYIEEEVWVLDPLGEDDDPFETPRKGVRARSTTSGAAGCTRVVNEEVRFAIDREILGGTLSRTTRLEGPVACGETPSGERTVDDVTGFAGAP